MTYTPSHKVGEMQNTAITSCIEIRIHNLQTTRKKKKKHILNHQTKTIIKQKTKNIYSYDSQVG